MTAPIQAEVTCPGCQKVVHHEGYSSVNVTLDARLREKVLSHEVFTFRCPHCALEASIGDPLLYHDMDRALMIQLEYDEAVGAEELDAPLKELDGVARTITGRLTTRLVRTPNALVEKILIFEAGLDDRIIEALKFRLKQNEPEKLPGDVYFEAEDEERGLTFVHVHEGQVGRFVFPSEAFQLHAAAFESLEPLNSERWPEVNEAYTVALYTRLAEGRLVH